MNVPIDWGFGVFHSGIEVGGVEYSFASGAGIFTLAPKEAPGATYRESIAMGSYEGTSQDAQRLLESMRHDFQGHHYHILSK